MMSGSRWSRRFSLCFYCIGDIIELMYTIKGFRSFAENVLSDYSGPVSYSGFPADIRHYQIQEARYCRCFNLILKYVSFHPDMTVVDVGCYPGEFGVLLKHMVKTPFSLIGLGLGFDPSFREKALAAGYNALYEMEFDPLNFQAKKGIPSRIPLPDHSVDLIFAGEIFEHLYHPLHFISEISRVLKADGILILTTPNLSYFGNVCRLLCGKSVWPLLRDSHLFFDSDWRPHERIYTASEIEELFRHGSMVCIKKIYMDNHYDRYERLSFPARLKQIFIRCFYWIPYFRPQYIGVFRLGEGSVIPDHGDCFKISSNMMKNN